MPVGTTMRWASCLLSRIDGCVRAAASNLEFRILPRGRDPPQLYAILLMVHFLNHALRLTCGKYILAAYGGCGDRGAGEFEKQHGDRSCSTKIS